MLSSGGRSPRCLCASSAPKFNPTHCFLGIGHALRNPAWTIEKETGAYTHIPPKDLKPQTLWQGGLLGFLTESLVPLSPPVSNKISLQGIIRLGPIPLCWQKCQTFWMCRDGRARDICTYLMRLVGRARIALLQRPQTIGGCGFASREAQITASITMAATPIQRGS